MENLTFLDVFRVKNVSIKKCVNNISVKNCVKKCVKNISVKNCAKNVSVKNVSVKNVSANKF